MSARSLVLFIWCVEGIIGYYTICLVWEEAIRVVHINDGRPTEDAFIGSTRKDSNWLISPIIQVLAVAWPQCWFLLNGNPRTKDLT